MGQGELDVGLRELHPVGPLQILGPHHGRPNDLNGSGPRAMPPGHLVVQLRNGAGELQIPEFAIHVVRAGPRVVPQPDAVVLDGPRVLLGELDAIEDLSGGFLHFAELTHEVPEFGFGHGGVGGEDDHAVGFGVGIFGGAGFAAHHLILTHFSGDRHDEILVRCSATLDCVGTK